MTFLWANSLLIRQKKPPHESIKTFSPYLKGFFRNVSVFVTSFSLRCLIFPNSRGHGNANISTPVPQTASGRVCFRRVKNLPLFSQHLRVSPPPARARSRTFVSVREGSPRAGYQRWPTSRLAALPGGRQRAASRLAWWKAERVQRSERESGGREGRQRESGPLR